MINLIYISPFSKGGIRGICKILFLICISFLTSNFLNLSAEPITLEKSIDIALKENPQMKISHQKVISAQAHKREAFGAYLPNLSGSLSYIGRNEQEDSAALNNITSISPSISYLLAEKVYDSKLSITQPVFMWGKIYNLNKQASLNYELANEGFRKTKNAIIYKVKQAFYSYILAEQMLKISKEAYDVTEKHLKVTKNFFNQGKSSSYDVSRAKVSLANSKTNLIKAENGFKLARESLLNVLNIKNQKVEFDGDLEYKKVDFNLDDLLNKALVNRPEIKQVDLRQKSAEYGVRIAASFDKPSIIVNGYAEWQNTEFKDYDWYYSWMAKAVLNIPIFDGFSTRHKIKQAKSNVEQVKLSKEELVEAVKLEVRAAYLNFEQAKESIEANKENIEAARENLSTAQKRFELGLMSDLEVRDAQLALTQAETNYTQSLYDYCLALASIEKSTGK